jgi:hypothetical protein
MALVATGKVTRLYVRDEGTRIRLEIPADTQPKEGYFYLDLTHPNYNALYSLALSAAVNGYPLMIRTDADITPTEGATVNYMVVDW